MESDIHTTGEAGSDIATMGKADREYDEQFWAKYREAKRLHDALPFPDAKADVEEPGEIFTAIIGIESELEHVVNAVHSLESRVSPVLRSGVGIWADNAKPESCGVELADRLRNSVELLAEIARHVQDMRQRVAL